MAAGDFPVTRVSWPGTHRLVMSHHPPIDLYDDIADPRDWGLVAEAVQRTNPRLAASYGKLDAVPVERRLAGQGASWVMAAFVHFSPDRPSRFSDGSYGVYYAGNNLETALREHSFHIARAFAATDEEPGWLSEVRELVGSVNADLTDLRGTGAEGYLRPDVASYPAPQALARQLRDGGANGLVYPSVRNPGGECIAAFWPDVVSTARQADHFRYHWNGEVIDFARRMTGKRMIFDLTH